MTLKETTLTATDVAAVVSHMNEDHSDAVLEYVQVYAGDTRATAALMTDITSAYMDIEVQTPVNKGIRVFFDTPVASRDESRIKLVQLLKLARSGTPPQLKIETITLS